MSTETEKKKKNGRLFWVIPILEALVIIAYFAIGVGNSSMSIMKFDFEEMFMSIKIAFYFLFIAIVVITILCFVPKFRSWWNLGIVIVNVLEIAWLIWLLSKDQGF